METSLNRRILVVDDLYCSSQLTGDPLTIDLFELFSGAFVWSFCLELFSADYWLNRPSVEIL
jgi:hypothetical protein